MIIIIINILFLSRTIHQCIASVFTFQVTVNYRGIFLFTSYTMPVGPYTLSIIYRFNSASCTCRNGSFFQTASYILSFTKDIKHVENEFEWIQSER